jgi:mycofactocin precursor
MNAVLHRPRTRPGEAGIRQHPVIEAAPAQPTLTADEPAGGDPANDEPVIADDLLVGEVSIDGMCGVY